MQIPLEAIPTDLSHLLSDQLHRDSQEGEPPVLVPDLGRLEEPCDLLRLECQFLLVVGTHGQDVNEVQTYRE